MKRIVSFITAGHSPREDIVEELRGHLSGGIEIRQRGALDHLSVEEAMEELRPGPGEPVLTSRLSDKSMADFSRKHIMPLLQKAIDKECENGADIVVILCTSEFDELHCRVPLIIPFRLLRGIVAAVKADCKAGALFPFKEFACGMEKNWLKYQVPVVWKCLTPGNNDWDKYIDFFKEEQAELLILDCIGYTYGVRDYFRQKLDIPVVHPRTLIVGMIHSLLGLEE